jgi:isopenicillin-N N-acyltransferase-like protein
VRILAIVMGALVLLLVIGSWSIDWLCFARPPKLAAEPAILAVQRTAEGERLRIGESWLERRDGIWRMSLSGDPFTRGYANAALTRELFAEQERSLVATVRGYVPSRTKLWLLRKYVTVRNRKLPEYVSADDQLEILGLARGTPDLFPEFGPLYHRLLNYHAAHDISHAVMDLPLVGCTAFAAWGQATADGHVLVGRNFDFSAGRCFDTNKVVMLVRPDQGHSYLSVAWPGMVGAVTGLNDAGIFVALNAGASDDARTIGTPASLVAREVLLRAGSLEQAIEVIAASRVFVTDAYLLADGRSGRAVVVEKTPARSVVRRSEANYLISANHFLSPEFKADAANARYMAAGTSVDRYKRMDALVGEQLGKLAPAEAADILRDRTIPGEKRGQESFVRSTPEGPSRQKTPDPFSPMGNAAALNPLIATHSVVADATAGILWVSAGPHQLGAYVPFSFKGFDAGGGAAAIPTDPMLADGSWARYEQADSWLTAGTALLKSGETAKAREALEKAVELNPDYYLPRLLLGKLALEAGEREKARALLLEAKALYPAYAAERALVEELLGRAEKEVGRR